MGKAWYASKTIWVNVVAFAATLGTIFGFDTGLTPEVQAQVVAAVMAVVNVVLRLITGEPIVPAEEAKKQKLKGLYAHPLATIITGLIGLMLLAACTTQAGAPVTQRQALFLTEQTFIRVVNQVADKCQKRVLTQETCLAASTIAETTQAALEVAWATATTDYDAIQAGIRQLQAVLTSAAQPRPSPAKPDPSTLLPPATAPPAPSAPKGGAA